MNLEFRFRFFEGKKKERETDKGEVGVIPMMMVVLPANKNREERIISAIIPSLTSKDSGF